MPIRPELALALDKPQPVDILGTAGQVLTLKNLVDQGRMGAMQLEQAERENVKRQSIADLARASGGDMGKFLAGYRQVAPLEAMDLEQRYQKSDLEMRKLQLDETEKRMGIAGRIFAALGPDPTPGQIMDGVSQAISMGSMKSFDGVPDPFKDPGGLKQWYQAKRRSFMDVKDQIEAERKALADARDASKPMSNVGKLLYDEELVRRTGGTFMPRQPGGAASGAADMTAAPKTISGEPMENILLTAARNEALGSPDQLFEWSPDGKRVLRQDVLAAQEKLRRAGASNITAVGGDMALGKTAQGKVDEGLLDTSAALMRVDRIGREYKPEWSTYLKQGEMGFNAFREKLGSRLSPAKQQELAAYTSWRASSLDNMNRTIKDLTGSAMGVEEANRIMATLPNPDDSPSQFQRKLEDAKQQTRMALARLTYIKRNGMQMEDVPLDRVPALINERGAQLEQETKKRFPSMRADEVSKMVKRQLAQEFGLLAD